MYSCGPLHVDEQRQDVQFEPTYSNSVPIQGVALRICWKQWTIGKCGERRSGISMLLERHDNDDDMLVVVHWSLSNSKSPQVSRTLHSILADLNNAIVRIISILYVSFSMKKFTSFLFLVSYHKVSSSSNDLETCLYLNIPENFIRLILHIGFWFVLVSFGSMIKVQFLAQFPTDHFYHPVMSTFIFLLH